MLQPHYNEGVRAPHEGINSPTRARRLKAPPQLELKTEKHKVFVERLTGGTHSAKLA